MMPKTYYMTLGIPRMESPSGIRRAFCDLVKRYHPDRLGLPGLALFQEVVRAYRVLSDPGRRRQYDEGLAHGEGRAAFLTAILVGGVSEPGSLVVETEVPLHVEMFRDSFEAAFARIADRLKGVGGPAEARAEGLDVRMVLPPEMAARGGTAAITVPSCSPCLLCGGAADDGVFSCPSCGGAGLSEDEETVFIRIPPGVGDGAILEAPLRGMGVHSFYLRPHIRVGL